MFLVIFPKIMSSGAKEGGGAKGVKGEAKNVSPFPLVALMAVSDDQPIVTLFLTRYKIIDTKK